MQLFQHFLKRASITFALLLTVLSFASAQKTISGKVTAAPKDDVLFLATVQVKGTLLGAVTDLNGRYTLEVPENAKTLVFSYTGFISQEVAITGTEINVSLSEGVELTNITVVGSRNASRTKLETPAAVDVIPVAQVANEMGQVDIQQILTFIAPSFQSARQTVADGTDHIDPAALRGLGPDQVLVLVNGKRRHQSALVNVNGTTNRGTVGTDMNAIPATSIERIEILRDGAAAQYGSDAIAGVINIVLKRTTGKLTGNVSYGSHITQYNKNYGWNKLAANANNQLPSSVSVMDGQTVQAGMNYGFNIEDKGYVNISGEFTQRGATNRAGTYTGALYKPNAAGVNVDDATLAANGLTRAEVSDMRIGNSAIKGGGLVVNGAYKINKKVEAYAFGMWNYKEGDAAGFYRYQAGYPTAALTNLNAKYPNGFLPTINTNIADYSTAFGFRGELFGINYDLSHVYGDNLYQFNVNNSVNYTQAIGTKDFQTSFNSGSLHYRQNTANLDLSKNFPKILAGLNVGLGGEMRAERYNITAGEKASWSNEAPSSNIVPGAQVYAGFRPSNVESRDRLAGGVYADLELDVFKTRTISWMLGGATRWNNYSGYGNQIFNYKANTLVRFFDGMFGVRGSYQTGFHAPSIQQIAFSKTTTQFVSGTSGLIQQEVATLPNNSSLAKGLGIKELTPETSVSYSAGVTARPIRGLEITADYYQIDIKDRIILTNNFRSNNNPALAALFASQNASLVNFFTNSVDTRSTGIEAVIAYGKTFNSVHDFRISIAGSLIKNEVIKDANGKAIVKASEILEQNGQLENYFNREDQARIEQGNPAQKANATLNYKWNKKLGVMVRGNYFGTVGYADPYLTNNGVEKPVANLYNAGALETLDQSFSPKTTFDASLSYQFTPAIGLTVGGTNITDVYPDAQTHSGNVSSGRFIYSRRVQQFGFNGAYYFARLNYNIGVKK
jgi:iron complex outermembrane recepter protein